MGTAIEAYLSPRGGSGDSGGTVGVENWDTLYSLVFAPLGFAADDIGFDVAIFWECDDCPHQSAPCALMPTAQP